MFYHCVLFAVLIHTSFAIEECSTYRIYEVLPNNEIYDYELHICKVHDDPIIIQSSEPFKIFHHELVHYLHLVYDRNNYDNDSFFDRYFFDNLQDILLKYAKYIPYLTDYGFVIVDDHNTLDKIIIYNIRSYIPITPTTFQNIIDYI